MAEKKHKKEADDQIKNLLDEIDLLNSEKKEVERIDSDTFKFNDIEYKLIENHQDGLGLEMFENRYTDYLLKYDYIVGDISYEKLRLRGFYSDSRKGVPLDMKISNLEDYLVEYCSFGCQYFVFERVNKKEEDPESYFKSRRSKRSNRQKRGRRNRKNQNQKQNQQKSPKQHKKRPQKKNKKSEKKEQKKDFQVIKKKNQESKSKKRQTNRNKKQTKNSSFEIRKKKE